jgi:P-type Cu+ transporter
VTETAAGPGMRETVLTIEGMTCAAWSSRPGTRPGNPRPGNRQTASRGTRAPRTSGTPLTSSAGLIVAVVFFVPLTDLSLMLSLIPSLRFAGWQWLLVSCAAPVALWSAWPFHRAALKNARHGSASMDTLVSLGIIAACGWSVYAMFVLDRAERGGSFRQLLIHASGGGIYLETAATVTTFLLAGRLYEARARRVAGQAMRELAAAGASDAGLLGPDGAERRVPASSLRPGDRFVVRPGEAIAADGEVVFGHSAVDRSMMTGESVPGEAAEGDSVIAGTVALTGRLVVRAARTPSSRS